MERVGKDERVDVTVLQTVGEKDFDGYVLLILLLRLIIFADVHGDSCWLLSNRREAIGNVPFPDDMDMGL